MRALTITRYGPPEVLAVRESPDPVPGPGQVCIRVARAGLNFADVSARVGLYPDAPKPPMVMGYEVSGTVAALGQGVSGPPVGTRVLAMTRFGGQATHALADARYVLPLPEGMDLDQAAALPVNWLTAHHMLHRVANLRPGMTLLVHMAAGGVGLAAIALARAVGGVEHLRNGVGLEARRAPGGRGAAPHRLPHPGLRRGGEAAHRGPWGRPGARRARRPRVGAEHLGARAGGPARLLRLGERDLGRVAQPSQGGGGARDDEALERARISCHGTSPSPG